MRHVSMVVIALALVGCGGVPEEDAPLAQNMEALGALGFDVGFSGCTEFAGIGFVPAANARPLVPASYALMGDATNAVIVVRAVDCQGIAVDGHKAKPGRLAQVGISLVGPDATADINNYTLGYETNHALLHARLTASGAKAQLDEDLAYTFTPDGEGGGALTVKATPPQGPKFLAQGTVVVPTAAGVPFTATWWTDGNHGTLGMRTTFPALEFGGAALTVTTPPGSALAKLIGGTTLTFPLLNSYNAFASARMLVRARTP